MRSAAALRNDLHRMMRSGEVQIMKWSSGTTWTSLGNPSDLGGYPLDAFDTSISEPIVCFGDYSLDAVFHAKRRLADGTWESIGVPGDGESMYSSIVFEPSANKAIVAYIVGSCGAYSPPNV